MHVARCVRLNGLHECVDMCDEIEIGRDNHNTTYNYNLFNRYCLPNAKKTIFTLDEYACMHAIDDSNGISQFKYYMLRLFLSNARLKDVFRRQDRS